MRRENKARLTVAAILLAAAVILFLTVKYIISNNPVWAGGSGQTIRTVVIDPGHGGSNNTKIPRLGPRYFCIYRNDFPDFVQPIPKGKA